ncbi:class I SAM-dependent methyltransferase [Taklimakanibacter deserti]|uniref:class I SAM-dependent methyltransferase n=1 Tax=Taklimakanibacter deserti TaxID=2267839 RepID=UPI000E64D10B
MTDQTDVAKHWEANAETWTKHARAGFDVYRDALNTPAFFAMLPPVAGLLGLDIACGEGSNTRLLARAGARMDAIDIAPTFIRHAEAEEEADPLGITYRVGDGMDLPYESSSFDFATSFMALMDMPDQGRVLSEIARVLKPQGFLQFSILHPCFVPPYRKTLRMPDGEVRAIEIGRYFDAIDGEVERWWFSTLPEEERSGVAPFAVPRFHRTLSQWVNLICGAGLVIEELGEPCASLELAKAEPVVADTRVAPIFLHVRARKPVNTR